MRAVGPQPVLVIGPRDSGKSRYVRELVARARERGRTVAGVLSEAELEDGDKRRYYARDLGDPGARMLLGSADPGPGLDKRVGRFHMCGEAFTALNHRIMAAVGVDLICVDEVGPLEIAGGGFAPALDFLLEHHAGVLLLTARPSVRPWLEERLRLAGGMGPTAGVQGFPTPPRGAAG